MATMLSEGGGERSARRTGGAGRRRERRPGGPAAWAVAAVVSDLERPRGPPVTCAQQLPRSTGATAHSRVPLRMPPSGNFISGQKKRGSLSAGSDSRSLSLSLSLHQDPKNPLRAES